MFNFVYSTLHFRLHSYFGSILVSLSCVIIVMIVRSVLFLLSRLFYAGRMFCSSICINARSALLGFFAIVSTSATSICSSGFSMRCFGFALGFGFYLLFFHLLFILTPPISYFFSHVYSSCCTLSALVPFISFFSAFFISILNMFYCLNAMLFLDFHLLELIKA